MNRKSKLAAAFFCGAVVVLAAMGIGRVVQVEMGSVHSRRQRPTIILDPGHGGVDGGAQANGVSEKEVNLAISLQLRDLLSAQGFRVIMTREDDRSIHDEGITQISRQKRSALYNRLAIIEDHPEAIFVSIHQNKFEQASSRGAQIFFSPNNPESQKLAQSIQETFVSLLQPENTRQIKKAENNLFLLYEAQIPAVMAECGFLSNPEEEGLLQDPKYQQTLAAAIAAGCLGGSSDLP